MEFVSEQDVDRFHRWCFSVLGVMLGGGALAQTVQPPIDESKLPEWVKRQARSPYKVIIESNAAPARPAASKPDEGTKHAVVAVKKPTAPAAVTAAAATPKPSAGAAGDAATATQSAKSPIAPAADAAIVTTFAPASPEPVGEALASPKDAVIEIAPRANATGAAGAAAPTALRGRVALTLLNRVEPVLTADLIDSRLDSANVVVAFTVNENGEVIDPSIAGSTDKRLNRSVLRAVKAWRYGPIAEPREHRVSFAFKSE